MQSTNIEEIKAALWEQAHHPCTRVQWGVAQVMAVRHSKKGHLQALLRGRGHCTVWKASPLNAPHSVQRVRAISKIHLDETYATSPTVSIHLTIDFTRQKY